MNYYYDTRLMYLKYYERNCIRFDLNYQIKYDTYLAPQPKTNKTQS